MAQHQTVCASQQHELQHWQQHREGEHSPRDWWKTFVQGMCCTRQAS